MDDINDSDIFDYPESGIEKPNSNLKVASLRDLRAKTDTVSVGLQISQPEDETVESQAPGDVGSSPVIVFDLEVDHKGTYIYLKGQTAVDSDKPPIVLVHDFGANSAHYRSFLKKLLDLGYSTYAYDLRGHGKSTQVVGHISRVSALVNDLLQIAAWVRHREDGKSPLILAHGMGAIIAMNFHQRHYKFCEGLVLVAPTLKLHYQVSRFKSMMITTLADLYPKLHLPRALTPRFFSRCKIEGTTTVPAAKLTTSAKITAQTGKEILKALETAPARFSRLKTPTLVMMGQEDIVAENAVLNDLLSKHKRRDLIEVAHLSAETHNIITENEQFLEEAATILDQWLQKNQAKQKEAELANQRDQT